MKKMGSVRYVVPFMLALATVIGLAACSQASKGGDASKGSGASGESNSSDYTLTSPGKLTFATSPDFPPFENLKDGAYVGFDIEIAKAVAKQMGLEAEFKNLQFDGITTAIAAGGQADAGISGITIEPEREKVVDFSSGYYTDDQAIAVMKGSPITSDNAESELNKQGVVIAVQSGTTGEAFVKENYPHATTQSYGNSTDCFAAVQAGQAAAVCTNRSVVQNMLADAYPDAQIVAQSATGEQYAIAVSKDNPGLKQGIDRALKALRDDGTIDRLTSEYLK
ncbi:extracellular solute-binding protein family 3 [Coriobacterium glomerans PW2]|uniref:Extracellular solute-binding protein family 3 n=1 Tax=Coriobacterium glomerans (strain ATCC 49209 / DSM 20642 / JCM 10262 / PW2) TaxID=700015 RepID=F2N8W2_CORGP|nr:ABC transporter substrate-binding protein [Coriobacterium glomerans]AEB07562.1 extracellular solute-binding protein family 3 [Coriobacterium glomerans PW2]